MCAKRYTAIECQYFEVRFIGCNFSQFHGYLISQFLSSYSNHRSDDYGGSVEGRYRFAHEVIQAVRPAVPADRLLTFRISDWGVADMEVSLFNTREEWQQIIALLDREPIDAISVSCYDFSADAFGTGQTMAALTREATSKPIMICGKIHDQASAEHALEHADIVLPLSAYAETSGTLVNAAAVRQGFRGAVAPPGEARPGWNISTRLKRPSAQSSAPSLRTLPPPPKTAQVLNSDASPRRATSMASLE